MGIFSKNKGAKGRANSFDFAVKVHAIEPWPTTYRELAVFWQRGSNKKGVTKSAVGTPHPGANWATFLIEDTIYVSATMTPVRGCKKLSSFG